eukprot:GAFH01005309.1.p3 GENE.GAFH01005309.1~~GAFH01005309.1.p3  ORF type:complete len:69 (+),score=3.64 GAFH01005309.1:305-511(+)
MEQGWLVESLQLEQEQVQEEQVQEEQVQEQEWLGLRLLSLEWLAQRLERTEEAWPCIDDHVLTESRLQ